MDFFILWRRPIIDRALFVLRMIAMMASRR